MNTQDVGGIEKFITHAIVALAGAGALAGGFLASGCNAPAGDNVLQATIWSPGDAQGTPASYVAPAPFVASGGDFACGVFEGVENCWGANDQGQTSVNGLSEISALAAGDQQACVLISGSVECWGNGVFNTPVTVSGLPTDLTAITAGGDFICALSPSQGVFCWGTGLIDTTNYYAPTNIGINPAGITQLVASHNAACVLQNGDPICWGLDTTATYNGPTTVAGVDTSIATTQMGLGSFFTCGIQNGAINCQGPFNGYGQLGDGSITSGATLVASGATYSCAVVNGAMECWGGQVDGTFTPTPHSIAGVDGTVTSIAVSADHACAINDGQIICWGNIAQPSQTSW